MKINEVRPQPQRGTRRAVFAHLNDRPDEIFRPCECDEIAIALSVPKRAVAYALWTLARDGFIGRAKLPRGVWYGSREAVKALVSACRAEAITAVRL